MNKSEEKCEHLWDYEEYNPHCHICGLLMRDDDKEKPLDWEREKDIKYTVDNIVFEILSWYEDEGSYQPTREEAEKKSKDFIRNLLEKEFRKGKNAGYEHVLDMADSMAEALKLEERNRILEIIDGICEQIGK